MNRRDFIQQASILSFAAASSSLLAACTKTLSCEDTAGLDDAAKQMRTALKYMDKGDPAKPCSTCNFYQAAAPDQCGGCTLIKGKINPAGSCTSWVKKA